MSEKTILETVCDLTDTPYPEDAEGEVLDQEFLEKLVRAAAESPIGRWNSLPVLVQEWVNTSITAVRESKEILGPDDFDAHYKPKRTLTVPKPVPSEPAKGSTPPRAAKSDGSTSAGGRTKGKGAGKKKGRAAKKVVPKKVVRRVSSDPENWDGSVVIRRPRARSSTSAVTRFALDHGINDWDRLCVELKRHKIKAGDSAVQGVLYGLRHVARALTDLGAEIPPMLAVFRGDDPAPPAKGLSRL